MTAYFLLSDTTTTELYTLSLHDALPISADEHQVGEALDVGANVADGSRDADFRVAIQGRGGGHRRRRNKNQRSEEHTSELQSRFDLVCRLLLEKKKKEIRRMLPLMMRVF